MNILSNDERGASLKVPKLEELPEVQLERIQLERNHIVGFNAHDVRARPFNLLRSQLVKRLEKENWKILGVTSATPEAGKSFLALNLAAALSRIGNRNVCLLDLDLRRGSLAEALGVEARPGIGDLLLGQVDHLSKIGVRLGENNLSFFPCFPTTNDTAAMLASPEFAQLLRAFRSADDKPVVICDLPPVFANDDTLIAAEHLDSYIFVVDQGVTTSKQVADALALLDPLPCLGTTLNRYSGGFADTYGYGYGYENMAEDQGSDQEGD